MSQNTSHKFGGGSGVKNGLALQRPHAPDRWEKRTPAAVPLLQAWQEGYVVRAPESNASEVRLYPPYDALLVFRAGLLRTVKHADEETVIAPRLTECPTCGNRNDPAETPTCQWCDDDTPVQPDTAGVSVNWGDSQ